MVFTTASNYLQELDKYVDRTVLPPCICPEGKGKAMDGMPQNFEGGLIPPPNKNNNSNNNSLAGTIPQNVDWLEALAQDSSSH